jgi:hypothetical protein
MYKVFDSFVVRTPILSVDYFLDLTKHEFVSDERLVKEFEKPHIKEAIYLASPVLFQELEKSIAGNFKEDTKIRESFLKYLTRMSTRATPFGLFSGCYIDKFSNLEIKSKLTRLRVTRLDMNLTGLLIQQLEANPEIRGKLLFQVNSSLYTIGDKIRFVESTYKNTTLSHQVIELEGSEYIEKIVAFCRYGKTIEEIAATIVEAEITLKDAINFVLELIDSQVLVSEIKLSVSGDESIKNLINILKKRDINHSIVEQLIIINSLLDKIDLAESNDMQRYYEIIQVIKSLNLDFQEKYVFQTDLTIPDIDLCIDETLKNDLLDAFNFINNITHLKENQDLANFKKAFIDRYEAREMPLTLVLDEEIGLGYPINTYKSGLNVLIEDLTFVSGTGNNDRIISKMDKLLLQKTIDAKIKNDRTIEIFEKDIADFKSDYNGLPDTFSVISQIVKINNVRKVMAESIFSCSSASILGRFCNSNPEINSFVNEISEYEQDLNQDKIMAEIVHLPENRVGNILLRPSIRKYEIPYLSTSTKETAFQINVNDIVIAYRNDKLVLINKSDGKEILPRLCNAHNFKMSMIPVYRFLSDMQFNKIKTNVYFDYSFLLEQFSYSPRILYKNIVLSTRKWVVMASEVNEIKNNKKGQELLVGNFTKWRAELDIPQYAYFVSGDNKLLINFCNTTSINVFFTEIKSRSSFMLEEFLFDSKDISLNENNEQFVNEVIFSYYKNKANES